jgi:hypothetical protein
MKRYVSSYVLCPFYHSEDSQKLYCEGVMSGTSIHLAFDTPYNKKNYRNKLCCRDYSRCYINRMLEEKYRDENE